ncbi:MAG: hypothetical protein JSV91_08690 [Phycisphaerales bacterium]|nr:MAG: hypothetical protein JSV91_08690 [Phycisphaerales bacterium]
MTVASQRQKIDDLMDKASESLARTAYFEAERMANKALGMARQEGDFDRMARIIMPLLEARRQRLQQALEVKGIVILDGEVTEDMKIDPGCYLVQPPLVGADARRFRLSALHREIPVAVVCREPLTQLGLCPIVTIAPAGSIRAKIEPPKNPKRPDRAWFVMAMEELGNFAIDSIDPELAPDRRVDAVLSHLDGIPEHEGLHRYLEQACRAAQEASRAASSGESASSPGRDRGEAES